MGLNSIILPFALVGEAKDMAKKISIYVKNIQDDKKSKLPLCLIGGGETTVTLKGTGKGGRNQEFVLALMHELKDRKGVSFLSAGTDGIDGNSQSAGGYGDWKLYKRAVKKGLDIKKYLKNNDSNSYLKEISGLVETGYTGTNVADVAVIIIDKKDKGTKNG